MTNQRYNSVADEIARMQNEQNEAYIPGSPSGQIPQPQPAGGSNTLGNQTNSAINVINEPSIGGYDEVFDPPVTEDYKCPLCMMVLRNPVQTPCGHRFCMACIQRHIATKGPTCPSDNEPLNETEVFSDNFAKREISQLSVKCRTVKHNKECPWTGPLQDIEEHLKTCEFVEVPCPKGCNKNVERMLLDHHSKKECPKRTAICSHCQTEVQLKNQKDHLGKCQKVTVACPNCNKKMLRERLTAGHLKECPKVQVCCEFRPYGCTWTGLRLHVQNHLTNAAIMAAHLSMLCVALSALFPDNGRGNAGTSASVSGSTSERSTSGNSSGSGSVSYTIWEELNRRRNRNAQSILTLEARLEQLERTFADLTSLQPQRVLRQEQVQMGQQPAIVDGFQNSQRGEQPQRVPRQEQGLQPQRVLRQEQGEQRQRVPRQEQGERPQQGRRQGLGQRHQRCLCLRQGIPPSLDDTE